MLMEWKRGIRPADRLWGLIGKLCRYEITENSSTYLGIAILDCANLHPLLQTAGGESLPRLPSKRLQISAPLSIPLASRAHSFRLSSRLGTLLREERIGAWTSKIAFQLTRSIRIRPDLSDQARTSDVIQDSDFRTEIGSPKTCVFLRPLRASGALFGSLANFFTFSSGP